MSCLCLESPCLCQRAPLIDIPLHLTLVIHISEWKKPTNSGKWALAALKNSNYFLRGRPDMPLDYSQILLPNHQPLLLYPCANAVTEAPKGGPIQLIVPDGNWNQGGRTAQRLIQNLNIPCLSLPNVPESKYKLRHETRANGTSTIEAIAIALKTLGHSKAAEELLAYMNLRVNSRLKKRGILLGPTA